MTTPTDPAELEKLKALAEAVTAGTWWTPETLYDPCDGVGYTDAAFIAAANPQVVAALIAEVERLRAEVAAIPFRDCEECGDGFRDYAGSAGLCRECRAEEEYDGD